MASGLLHIAEQLRGTGQTQAGIQGEDAGASVLWFGRKTVPALVRRMKGWMPLRNNICLARKPNAVCFRMGKHDRYGVGGRSRFVRRRGSLLGLRILSA